MFKKAIDGVELKEIPIDRILRSNEDNPRMGVNDARDELKSSIKETLARHVVLEVSQAPGSEDYCLYRGGNTRLVVLWELYSEWNSHKENPYKNVKCMVFRWNEADKKILSATENLVRGELCYAEQARAIRMLKETYDDNQNGENELAFDEWVKRMGVSMKTSSASVTRYLQTDTYITPFMPKLMVEGKAKQSVAIVLLNLRASLYKIMIARKAGEVNVPVSELLMSNTLDGFETKEQAQAATNRIMEAVMTGCDAITLNKDELNSAVVKKLEYDTGYISVEEKSVFVAEDNLVERFASRYKLSSGKGLGDDKRKNAAALIHDAISEDSTMSSVVRNRVMKELEVNNDVGGFLKLASHLDSAGRNMIARMVKEA